jgi:hypothetical protein
MTRIALGGGSYVSRSLAASAQRCLNLYPEIPPPNENAGSPPTFFATAPPTYYLTPGLVQIAATTPGVGRGLYQCTQDANLLYGVIGPNLFSFNAATNDLTVIGQITAGATPVSMQDNGLVLVIADGTPTGGWYVTLGTNSLVTIADAAWQGATSIVVLDTYLGFSVPGKAEWYLSPSNYIGNSTPFDPLYVATKSTYPDPIVGMSAVNGLIWLIGDKTSEAWYDAGAADFPFQRVPQVLIQHGCVAPASISSNDGAVYFLSRDQQGRGVVLAIEGEAIARITTFPIEYAISQYAVISDAIGMTYQQQGHAFYVLTFPSADKTWVYDVASQMWHERCSLDAQGNEHCVLFNALAYASTTVAMDKASGLIYRLDPGAYTDNGMPIKRQRCFAHMIGDGTRIFHRRFVADLSPANSPQYSLLLDWSDNRGFSFGSALEMPMGIAGAPATVGMYDTYTLGGYTWWRLGYSRDRVYRLTWTAPLELALQGAWVQADAAAS